jgi:putative FmdB family regulatory protein
MALFEFSCTKCDHEFEQLIFQGESPVCPSCKGTKLIKKWSLPSKPGSNDKNGFCDTNLPPCNPYCCKIPSNIRK